MEYGTEVTLATAGLGIGLSVVFGTLAFISMLAMCCRCKRLHREDLAMAEAERNTGGQFEGTPPGGGRQRSKGTGMGGLKRESVGWRDAGNSLQVSQKKYMPCRYIVDNT